ncbi:MAG: helix-turn-helix transcriptional regulator [Halodesulfurarchaeum sp.]
MRRSAPLVVVLLILSLPAFAAAPGGAVPSDGNTVIRIHIQPDGDGRWAVSVRIPLNGTNETAAFERLRAEFVAGKNDQLLGVSLFREAAQRVSERTGQEMEITAVNRTGHIKVTNGTRIGVLTLRFLWTNFAQTEGTTISVGQAFAGGWFGNLEADQRLVIEPPAGYQVQTARPSTDIVGGALQWDGPQQFQPGEPAIKFRPATTPTTTRTPTPTPTPATPSPPTTPPPEGIPWTMAAVGFSALVVGGLVLLAWQGGYLGGETAPDDEGPPGGASPPGTPAEEAEPEEEPEGTSTAGEPEPDDEELLSDEERIERLLRHHGGRMKQAQIVEETRWSNAKVSQLLSSMAEDEQVEKLRIGRENLISLPEYEEEE